MKKSPKEYLITIADSGIGIEAKELKKIFHQYYQAGEIKQEGLGLGLYFVKYIIQKHHGTINVTSSIGKGTTITITLPLHT